MSLPQVVFYGASSHSHAVAHAIAMACAPVQLCEVVAFLDDFAGGNGQTIEGRPVIAWDEWQAGYRQLPCLFPVGSGTVRRALHAKVIAAGGHSIALYDRPHVRRPGVALGVGTILLAQTFVGCNTVIGDHAQVMPMVSIGHDVTIGAFATVSPSATISGYVEVGEAAFVGANATIINGRPGRPLVIGAGATIAAGAVVMKSVAPDVTVIGNPARTLRQAATRTHVR